MSPPPIDFEEVDNYVMNFKACSSNCDATYKGATSSLNSNVLVYYVAYNGTNNTKISIGKDTQGNFTASLITPSSFTIGGSGQITISNLNNYKTLFNKEDPKEYPTWINLAVDGKTYTISNTKDQYAKVNYICQEQINTIFPPGSEEDPEATCESLFGSDFLNFLNSNVITIVRLGIPLLLILFTTFDFAKVVFVDDKDGIQKAGKRFGKRIVAAILIFLVKIIGAPKVEECSEFLNSLETEQGEVN